MVEIGNDWDIVLKDFFEQSCYKHLKDYLTKEYAEQTIYPSKEEIFNAFKYTSYKDTRVVILGQDPYYREGLAHGLSFSVKEGVKIPMSLMNIFKEIEWDLGLPIPKSGSLIKWAEQGVLLLNTVLTVREGKANTHKDKGWEIFTDYVIELLDLKEEPVIFVLWGSNAKTKMPFITQPTNAVLTAAHPSPLAAYNGFFGCRHFSKINEILLEWGQEPIKWQ